ncbi:MAG: hypothetical protein Ta2A_04880 [Treponemataceae bacterium]|nr:MAG: hypothetical protein Ta2A_04880 [Treponemataceae bacterium]
MKTYAIRFSDEIGKSTDFLTVMSEEQDGFMVSIIKTHDGEREEMTDFIGRDMFEGCLRTGYLTQV